MNTTEESLIEYLELEIVKNPERFHDDMKLTELEEEIMNELDIDEYVWNGEDYSFFMYTWLVEKGYLND